MSDETYNGWSNYATWRVQLEIVDDYVSGQDDRAMCESTLGDLATQLEEFVDDVLTNWGEISEGLALDYARAFVSDVNWYELAKSAQENVDEMYPETVDA